MHASNICKTCKVERSQVWQHRESAPAPFGQGMLGQMGMQYCICSESKKAVFGEFQKPYWDGHNFCLLLFPGHEPTPTQNRTPPFLFSSFPTPFTKLLCLVKRFWLGDWNHVSLLIFFFYAVENHKVKRSLNPD
jgi:hypothetical protein